MNYLQNVAPLNFTIEGEMKSLLYNLNWKIDIERRKINVWLRK